MQAEENSEEKDTIKILETYEKILQIQSKNSMFKKKKLRSEREHKHAFLVIKNVVVEMKNSIE